MDTSSGDDCKDSSGEICDGCEVTANYLYWQIRDTSSGDDCQEFISYCENGGFIKSKSSSYDATIKWSRMERS